jgi:serine phosphatase RsbU (regulator of sigma subunit)
VAGPTLAIGAASRPYPGETANGDAWQVDWHAGVYRIAVIDGVGHGAPAAAAAETARAALAAHPELGPAAALRECHRVLAGTRGAVIGIAAIDLAAARLTFAGIGNVDAWLWLTEGRQRPISYRGILGVASPSVRSFDFELNGAWCLVMHTDGISSRAEIDTLPAFSMRDMPVLAAAVLDRWARPTDDATVVAVCPAARS